MTTRTVITRTRKQETTSLSEFNFTKEMLPVEQMAGKISSDIKDYANKAWETFSTLPMPSITDEPWRRTDLKSMPAGKFQFTIQESPTQFSSPPEELLEPLTGNQHAGQIMLTQKQPEVWLDPQLRVKAWCLWIFSAPSRSIRSLSQG